MSQRLFQQVGFVGLGSLGFPICRNLAQSGVNVIAYDTQPQAERVATLRQAGARVAESLPEVATGSDLIITVLPDSDAVESVLLCPALLSNLTRGTICAEMSSGYPATTVRIASILLDHGVKMLDAPICNGGVGGAHERRITLCVGGEAPVVERVRPALELVASHVMHVGPLGSGHALKIINNSVAAAYQAVVAEGLALGMAYGFELQTLISTLGHCSVNGGQFVRLAQRFAQPPGETVSFRLALATKDVRYASVLAGSLGVPHLVSDAAHSLLEVAQRVVGADTEATTGAWQFLDRVGALKPRVRPPSSAL